MKSPDLSQYLGVFLDEGNEQIDLLEQHLLEIEKTEASQEALQVMFRAAHTLKGSSRTMGFLRIGDLTHEMESVLDDMRNDQLELSTDVVNALLECMDLLKQMMAAVQQSGNDESFDQAVVKELVDKLIGVRTGEAKPQQAAKEPPKKSKAVEFPSEALAAAEEARKNEVRVWQIDIKIKPDCALKSVRYMMSLSALAEQGEVLAAIPDEAASEAEEFDGEFTVLIATDLDSDGVEKVLCGLSEMERHTVQAFGVPQKEAKQKKKSDPETEAPTATVQAQSSTIRVATSRLDSLLNLVGELVIDRAQITRIAKSLEDTVGNTEIVSQLNEATHRIARITTELQDEIMKTRLLPIDGVFQRMPRMVRDVCQKIGKEVDFQISGGETELDRSLLDVLADPIIHLLRNSVDHGIEMPDERLKAGKSRVGLVELSASHQENHIVIEIKDDGKGIDPEKIKEAALRKGVITQAIADTLTDHDAIKLIFASGFSTAAALSDISGRGVGMDIVKSNVEKIGGRIQVESTIGQGSVFRVHLPLTLAILRALLVHAGTASYAIPLASVVETVRLGSTDLFSHEKINGKSVLVLRGETVPLANLVMTLEGDEGASLPESIGEEAFVVVVGFADKKVGLCVEQLLGEQEVVIKPLGKLLGDLQGISGASILGDGRVALIVDCARAVNV